MTPRGRGGGRLASPTSGLALGRSPRDRRGAGDALRARAPSVRNGSLLYGSLESFVGRRRSLAWTAQRAALDSLGLGAGAPPR